MWSGWAVALADDLGTVAGRPIAGPLYAMLGYDPVRGVVTPGGGLAATPMARLRERTRDVLIAEGMEPRRPTQPCGPPGTHPTRSGWPAH